MILIYIMAVAMASSNDITNNEVHEYLDTIKYNPMDRPNTNGSPINVSVQLGLFLIRNVDKNSFTYNVAMAIRLWWLDHRFIPLNNSQVK